MADDFSVEAFDARLPEFIWKFQPLPPWIARRLLKKDEEITWVRGTRYNPWWEKYVTHPGLIVPALALALGFLAIGRLIAGTWMGMPAWAVLGGGAAFFGCVYLLGIANTYFTRLVVTNLRIVIMQGYEVCKSWPINRLPPALLRYRRRADGRESKTIDLTALQTMLGGASDQFVESKTILNFGKQLDQIKRSEKERD